MDKKVHDQANSAGSNGLGCDRSTAAWNEAERLAALDEYAILDTDREKGFDDVASLAADILNAPIAVVNLIAADRQWFKAEVGIGADSLPLDVSICRHAILQPGVFVVEDLSKDSRFEANPLVHVAGGLRFYAGALLETPEGLPLGTVCVLDTTARPNGLSAREERALKVLAAQTMAQLELRKSLAAQTLIAQKHRESEEALRSLNLDLERQVVERTEARGRSWAVSPDLIGALNSSGLFETSNPAWLKILGWQEDEVRRTPIWELIHPDDLERSRKDFELAQIGRPSLQFQNRYRCKDGSYRWISWIGVPANDLVYCTGRDITIQRAQTAALAERTAELRRFHEIVEATASPICAFDAEYRLVAFNRAHNDAFRRVNGFDTKLGDVFPDLFIPEQRPVMRALMSRALAGEVFTVTEEFGRPELGQPIWEISYTPLRNEAGEIIGAFHLATDISDRLRAESDLVTTQEALRQSRKMEAMGQLTGGVAHDFNNLLTPIVGALDLLQRRGIGGEREQRLISGAVQSAERAKVLVQRLLAFARRQPLKAVAVDVCQLVTDMAGLVSSTTGPQIKVTVEIPADLPPAIADANQLEMALLNLCVNARDAMPEGGTLLIAAAVENVSSEQDADLQQGAYIKLSVTDTGVGMDDETVARAAEPFFSTKGIGKGTGLGLSMAHGLASQLGGALRIISRVGFGTTIQLWLPQSSQLVSIMAQSQDPPVQIEIFGTALLVDDEELVRISTADMLSDLGYSVIEASSAEEALRLLDGGLEPDLLVTDHLMPGMSGTELASILRVRPRHLPTLIVSGYAEGDGITSDLPRLTKPFRNEDLAAALAALSAQDRPLKRSTN